MTRLLFFAVCLLSVLGVAGIVGCQSGRQGSVVQAEKENKALPGMVNGVAMTFLVEMTDARLMDFAEGELAAKKGTTSKVRKYGRLMMQDQKKLLGQLREIAQQKKIVLPGEIGSSKQAGLADLKKMEGRDFDKQFLVMIARDHERDLGELRRMIESGPTPDNLLMKDFAEKNLALIESHLAKAKNIAESEK